MKIARCAQDRLGTRLAQGHGAQQPRQHLGKAKAAVESIGGLGQATAEEYLDTKVAKWGPAVAVRIATRQLGGREAKALGRLKEDVVDEQARLSAARKALQDFPRELVSRCKERKSKLKTCGKCDSRVNVSFLQYSECPVCRSEDFLMTPTNLIKREALAARLPKHEEKLKELNEKIRDLTRLPANTKPDKVQWFLHAICAS